MKLSELFFVLSIVLLFSICIYGGFSLLEKEKNVFAFKEEYEMLVFINQDFKAKCCGNFFQSTQSKNEWMQFIQRFFALEKIKIIDSLSETAYLYCLEFSVNGEEYTIKYSGRLDEK